MKFSGEQLVILQVTMSDFMTILYQHYKMRDLSKLGGKWLHP